MINNIEKELSKKVNLENLNYALNAQSKLNEALNSTSQICRMCWDSEGILTENKYINGNQILIQLKYLKKVFIKLL